MVNTYKMADRLIEIHSIYELVHEYCQDYTCEGTPDFTVEISQSDIEFERKKSESEFAFEGLKMPDFSDAELETTAVYRKIAEIMPTYDTIVFHGSVIAVDGEAYLFTAKSGTGKSTHTMLWRELFGERAVMVNDDKPLLKITENGVIAYGSPYNGKHHLGCNMSAPLKGICILHRGQENTISQISKSQAYAMLMQQVYRPKDGAQLAKVLKLIDRLSQNTGLFELHCNMDPEAAKVAFEGMKGAKL